MFFYLACVNGAFTTIDRILRGFAIRSWKTEMDLPLATQPEVKTRFDHSSTLPRKASLADPELALVYFVAGAGLIKIGVSTNVKSRFRAIRNSSPVPVELLGTVPGGTVGEGFLHCSFPHLRRHGEWFEDTPELRDHIARCLETQQPLRNWSNAE